MSLSPSSALADKTGRIRPATLPTASALEFSCVGGERLLTVKEAARSLGLCVDSVRRHLRSGKLQGVRVGGGWRVPESKLAIQLGLMAVAAVPGHDVIEEERERVGPTRALVATPSDDADNQLLDALFQADSVRVRVLQLVEAAGVSAAISPDDRAHLAHELEAAWSASGEPRDLEA